MSNIERPTSNIEYGCRCAPQFNYSFCYLYDSYQTAYLQDRPSVLSPSSISTFDVGRSMFDLPAMPLNWCEANLIIVIHNSMITLTQRTMHGRRVFIFFLFPLKYRFPFLHESGHRLDDIFRRLSGRVFLGHILQAGIDSVVSAVKYDFFNSLNR